MKIILFGATGMIGAGTLIECLADPRVSSVLVIGRSSCSVTHAKLREIVRANLFDLGDIRGDLVGYDATFFCLGVSAVGMTEDAYRRVTRDLTLSVAQTMAAVNSGSTFCYISGQGADSTERGRAMWARVKGETENRLLELSLKAFMLRPGYIQPLKGVRSRTNWYQMFYNVMGPFYPLIRRLAPGSVTNTAKVGRAMIQLVLAGYDKKILENPDINALAARR
jgi:uncharacterized protein YbjT (DUF2867 family)